MIFRRDKHAPAAAGPSNPLGEEPLLDDEESVAPAAETGSDDLSPEPPAPPEPPEPPASPEPPATTATGRGAVPNMLPGRERRRSGVERLLSRLIATCGVVGIGVAISAIMVSSKSQGWITGLVVAGVSVILSAILWSSRQL